MLKKAIASLSIACAMFFSSLAADAPKAIPASQAAQTPEKAAPSAAPAAGAPMTDAKSVEKTIVYKAKVGSRYHVKGCRYLKNAGTAISVGDAVKQGLAPCNVCHAPKLKRE